MNTFTLRPANSQELPTLIEIDDEACELYEQAGLNFDIDEDHPFVLAESRRWAEAINQGLAYVAVDRQDYPVGFISMCAVDGEPYLDQLAVRPAQMRKGLGRSLLRQALSMSAQQPLWLTTYSHLPFNAPFYESEGFVAMPEEDCGPQLRAILDDQRSVLPAPDKRIAMLRRAERS